MIDTKQAMEWLSWLVEQKGAKLSTKIILGDLFDQELDLHAKYKADAIANATGLAGMELADDTSCYRIRGVLLRVINDGSYFPKLDRALMMTADAVMTLMRSSS